MYVILEIKQYTELYIVVRVLAELHKVRKKFWSYSCLLCFCFCLDTWGFSHSDDKWDGNAEPSNSNMQVGALRENLFVAVFMLFLEEIV